MFSQKAVGLALMASPSLGSKWADVFGAAADFYNQGLGAQLSWDDKQLQDVHWQFADLVNNRHTEMPGLFGREAAEHHLVYRKKIPKWLRWLVPPGRQVVDKVSASQYFGQVHQIPETDHFSIVKPDSLTHLSHEFLVQFIEDFRRIGTPEGAAGSPGAAERPTAVAAPQAQYAPVSPRVHSLTDVAPVHFYTSDAGFSSTTGAAVVSCVVVDDVETLEHRWREVIASLEQDPALRAAPGAADTIRERRLGYREAGEDVRHALTVLLQRVVFEAYVAFARQVAGSPSVYSELLRAITFDRLRAYRSRSIQYSQRTRRAEHADLAAAVLADITEDVRRRHAGSLTDGPSAVTVSRGSAGLVLAEYVAEITRERLDIGPSARAFNFVHPMKIRVMHDLAARRYYNRKDPFTG